MPQTTDILRQRERRRRRKKTVRGLQNTGISLVLALSLGAAVLGLLIALAFSFITAGMPSLSLLPALLDPEDGLLAKRSVIMDRDQTATLLTLGAHERRYLFIDPEREDNLSPNLLNATIAAQDPQFWQHDGFQPRTFLQETPDTIPLLLVSELVFWEEPPGLQRTIREKIYAAQVVSEYSREQILEWYLNSAYYGQDAFGAHAAARLYFGKPAADLTLGEAAVLAAASQAPDINPFTSPELSRARRDEVLKRMQALGSITEQQASRAAALPLGASTEPEAEENQTGAFIDLLFEELAPHIPELVLKRGSLVIVSTLDLDLQVQFECALLVQLDRLEADTTEFPADCEAARLLPTNIGENVPAPGAAAELVALDPLLGQILALATGRPAPLPPNDPAPRPAGSLLSPFIYLSAFTRGFSPASLAWDIPANLTSGLSGSPNFDGSFHGPVRIRTALANDYLVPALDLMEQIGPTMVWETAAQLGMPSLLASVGDTGGAALDGRQVSLLEAAQAYGVFSTQGVLIGYPEVGAISQDGRPAPLKPTTILRVVGLDGRVWVDFGPPQARPVTSAPLAFSMTHVLSDEAARWPSLGHPNALEIGRPAGAKNGFTQDFQNAWTVGFTPQLVIGAWIGFEGGAGEGEGRISPLASAGLWHAATKYAVRDMPVLSWSMPPDITEVEVCDPSGMLPTTDCPTVVREIFMPGNQPNQLDTLYQRFAINRETGLLATVFTPPELIDTRVFLVPPPEAASWAQQAGLPVPPENYDLVSRPPADSEEVRILSPGMFDYIRGEVEIRGAAFGPDFENYSVQVGAGLNPQQWLQLGSPSETPAFEGRLATWDTAGLNGLYAVRLLVVRTDNLIETSIIQVTVDNTPPEVEILHPVDGQVFNYPLQAPATFQFFARDELQVDRVEVYLDNELLQTFTQQPYALSLDLQPGGHLLRLVAYDLAGNMAETQIDFTVER